jgi:hypothetical protein
MKAKAWTSALALVALTSCGGTEKSSWSSRANTASPFHAILYQTTYNSGETAIYEVRFERDGTQPSGGWFVKKELEGDIPVGPRPALVWTSPNYLTVLGRSADLGIPLNRKI